MWVPHPVGSAMSNPNVSVPMSLQWTAAPERNRCGLAVGWACSLVVHTCIVVLIVGLAASFKPPPMRDVFTWNVTLVTAPGEGPVAGVPRTEADAPVAWQESVRPPSEAQSDMMAPAATSPAPTADPPPEVIPSPMRTEWVSQSRGPVAEEMAPVVPLREAADVSANRSAESRQDSADASPIDGREPAQPERVMSELSPEPIPPVQSASAEPKPEAAGAAERVVHQPTDPLEPASPAPGGPEAGREDHATMMLAKALEPAMEHDPPAGPVEVAGERPASPAPRDYRWLAAALRNRIVELKRYPPEARASRLEGRVVVRAVVDPRGEIVDVAVAVSSGHQVLDHEAIELVQRASPLTLRESIQQPQVVVKIPVSYSLRN